MSLPESKNPAPNAELEPILDALKNGVPDNISLTHRCRLYQRIYKNAWSRANQYGLFTSSQRTTFLPGNFEAEDDALAKLSKSFSLSRNFSDFFNKNASQLGQSLATTHPLHTMKTEWISYDTNNRLQLLKDILHRQFDLFAHDTLRFLPPEIKIESAPTGNFAYFIAGNWALSNRIQDKGIYIKAETLNTYPITLLAETIWHEGTHSLCQQMAAARNDGTITDFHPFAADAEICKERHNYKAFNYNGLFKNAYREDPEENLAYEGASTLTQSWEDESRLSRRMIRKAQTLINKFKPA